ncbi:hypothetical protein BT96DRAFT_1106001, partial [Gymnopus androsaceus JB14]
SKLAKPRHPSCSVVLMNLARPRVDIFGAEVDEERRKREEEEEREREGKGCLGWSYCLKGQYSGQVLPNVNFDEQIAATHRSKGLRPYTASQSGIGPAATPGPLTSLPPSHASLPTPPHASSNPAYLTATVSLGPQPASAYQTPPVMLPPLHFQGVDPTPGFGFQSAPGMHPSRVAALAAANGVLQSQAGVVRTADQMEDVEDDIPPAKRQKVNKVPGSQIYSEEDWIGLYPVS